MALTSRSRPSKMAPKERKQDTDWCPGREFRFANICSLSAWQTSLPISKWQMRTHGTSHAWRVRAVFDDARGTKRKKTGHRLVSCRDSPGNLLRPTRLPTRKRRSNVSPPATASLGEIPRARHQKKENRTPSGVLFSLVTRTGIEPMFSA